MKLHTSGFKNGIKLMGKEIASKIIYTLNNEEIELTSEDLNFVSPHYKSSILKSTMKQLDIDSNILIPEGTIINYQFGLKVGNSYEYLNYGNYVVYKIEEQKDTNSYKIICYDKMLYSMIPYESMNITYPISIRDYLGTICNKIGLQFKNSSDTFANYDKMIQNELYLDSDGNSLDYTFRDVLDELAQVTASTICIDEATDKLEVRYINETNDTINEEYLKDVNVEFGKKYGPINSIVLSRSAETDNVYLQDEESIEENGLCEIKIKDNQIMNFNDRSDYLEDILDVLDGLEYYINDFSSTGIMYYNLCDKYNVSIGENIYNCIIFNDEPNITQGLEENIFTEMPEETETDYTKADKTDRRINKTYLIVDKQNQEIQALAEKIVDVSTTESGIGQVEFENASLGALGELKIKGTVDIIYPSNERLGSSSIKSGLTKSGMKKSGSHNEYLPGVYPEDDLYMKSTYLIIRQEDKEDIRYKLPINYLRKKGIVSDEFVWKYNKMTIIRRIGVDAIGETYILANEYEEDLGEMEIILPEGDGMFIFESFPYSNLTITYMYKNEYTETFATKIETKAEIKITTDEIMSEVSKKVGDDEIISKINQSAEEIQIDANKISLNGKTIEMTSDNINISSNNFNVDNNGNMTCSNANVTGNIRAGSSISLSNNISEQDVKFEINSQDGSQYFARSDRNYLYTPDNREYIANRACDSTGEGYLVATTWYNNYDSSKRTEITSEYVWTPEVISAVYNQGSLENIKKNIEKYDKALKTILSADLYSYNLKTEDDKDKKHIGLIISTSKKKYNTPDDVISKKGDGVDLYSMISMSWQAIKEQQKTIEELEKRINLLEKESEK